LVPISRVTYKSRQSCLVAVTYKSVASTQGSRGKSGNKSLYIGVELLIQLISWSTLSQGCFVSQVTYFTLFALKVILLMGTKRAPDRKKT
jgi:hypothetical protein